MISLTIKKSTLLYILALVFCVALQSQVALASDKYGGGSTSGGGSYGGGGNTWSTGNTTWTSSGGNTYWSNDYNGDGDINDANEFMSNSSNGGGNGGVNISNSSSKPSCTQAPDIRTVDILYVRAGTYSGSARPAASLLVDKANLVAGVSYQPVVQLRNLNCRSTAAFNPQSNYSTPFAFATLKALVAVITPNKALAGGGGIGISKPKPSVPKPNVQTGGTLVGSHVNQSPFGVSGGFPIRLQIDYGQNGSFEYTQFLNNQGPIKGAAITNPTSQTSITNSTIYVTFPAFTINDNGNHAITASADVTNTQAPGRGCTSLTAGANSFINSILGLSQPAPVVSTVDWGCIRERTPAGAASETNNVLTQTITVGQFQGLAVGVQNVQVSIGGTLNTVPFTVQNQSTSTLPGYTYTISIGGSSVGSGNRTVTLTPNQIDSVQGAVTYTVPNSNTTVPLEVCATSALLATTSCATAQVIVSGTALPECSDGVNNDPVQDVAVDAADNGCFINPFDPDTYDPNDDNEGGIITLDPPILILTANRPIVRTNEQVTISYEITAPYAITCTLTGAGISETINHVPGTTNDTAVSQPLQNKQRFTLSCPGFNDGTFQVVDSAESLDVEIVPEIQEV